VKQKAVTLLTAGIWIVIFAVGLWPFNFVPENRIRWLPGGAGLGFGGYGQAYSSVPIFLPSGRDGAVEGTIELVFTPSKSYRGASSVFSVVGQDEVSFTIGQSVTDLFLQGSFTNGAGEPVAKLWIDDVCGDAEELFVTVMLGTHNVNVYLDGHLARSFPVSTRTNMLLGKVLVGHSVKGGGRWSGSVARLAIFEGTHDAADVSRRYERWTITRHLDKDADHHGDAYEFDTPAEFVINIGDRGLNLVIPKTFRLSKPEVLEWPDHLNRSVVVDAVINIIGFIPFGLGTCLCLRFWTGWNISRCVAMTILVGASASLVVEVLQVLLPTRDSSLADLVTNILGTAIGAGAAVIGR
jgi:VanZ like protein